MLAFAVYSACVDPDRVLRALRPLARRSALTAALVSRMVPVAVADAARIREAAELRGPAAEPVGRPALARRLVEGSLDRTIDVAATLELRGHSLGIGRPPAAARARRPAALLLVGAAGVDRRRRSPALVLGAGGFEWYPADLGRPGRATLALCAALPLLAPAFPFAGASREGAPWLSPSCARAGSATATPGAAEQALDGIDLEVEPGELVVLAGPRRRARRPCCAPPAAWCRTSTAARSRASSRWRGCDVRDHGPAELAAVVGLVAQEPETQVVSTTVRAEVELPLELRGADPAARARAVEEVALALGIADLLERTTDTLSGGELQRVALAAALATRPSLVLLDEPTSQLDPVAGDELIGLLRRLNEECGVAIVLGEHRLERCLGAADRVVAMERGRDRLRRRARRPSSTGRWTSRPRWRPRARGCSGAPACRRPRASARPGAAVAEPRPRDRAEPEPGATHGRAPRSAAERRPRARGPAGSGSSSARATSASRRCAASSSRSRPASWSR